MAITNYYYNNRIYPNEYYRQEPHEYAEERFRKKYQLHVENSKRHYRHRSIPISYRDWLKDGAEIPFHQEVEREPLLKVYMSKEHYEQLVAREQHLEELEHNAKRLSKMERSQLLEQSIRINNPSVQKAYEKYQMLLKLVE